MRMWLETWAFDRYRACNRDVAAFRVFFAVAMIILTAPRYTWMVGFPDSFYAPPPGPGFLVGGFPPAAVLLALDAVAVLALVFVAFGRFSRSASLIAALALLVGNTFLYSFGKVNHDILPILTLAIFGLSGWGEIPVRRGRGELARVDGAAGRSWPLALTALVVGIGMFWAGLQKAQSGWLDLDTQAVLGWLHNRRIWAGHVTPLSDIAILIEWPPFWEMADWSTILLECAFLAAAIRCGSFRLICAIATFFHAGVYVLMDITFSSNLIVYAAFIDWSVVRERLPQPRVVAPDWLVAIGGLLIAALLLGIGNPARLASEAVGFPKLPEVAVTALAVLVASAFLLRLAAFRIVPR